MNNQENLTILSSKLKVRRANSQTISSYLLSFSTDIIFFSLVSFAFCLLGLFCFLNNFLITGSTKILTLAIATFLFISVGVLCRFAMVPVLYILLSPQEEEVHSYFLTPWGDTFDSTFIKKIYTFVCHCITMPR